MICLPLSLPLTNMLDMRETAGRNQRSGKSTLRHLAVAQRTKVIEQEEGSDEVALLEVERDAVGVLSRCRRRCLASVERSRGGTDETQHDRGEPRHYHGSNKNKRHPLNLSARNTPRAVERPGVKRSCVEPLERGADLDYNPYDTPTAEKIRTRVDHSSQEQWQASALPENPGGIETGTGGTPL
jgi:hypothetical protein